MAGLLPRHRSGASQRRAGGFGLRATLNKSLARRASRGLFSVNLYKNSIYYRIGLLLSIFSSAARTAPQPARRCLNRKPMNAPPRPGSFALPSRQKHVALFAFRLVAAGAALNSWRTVVARCGITAEWRFAPCAMPGSPSTSPTGGPRARHAEADLCISASAHDCDAAQRSITPCSSTAAWSWKATPTGPGRRQNIDALSCRA